jgi:hypothetical protein
VDNRVIKVEFPCFSREKHYIDSTSSFPKKGLFQRKANQRKAFQEKGNDMSGKILYLANAGSDGELWDVKTMLMNIVEDIEREGSVASKANKAVLIMLMDEPAGTYDVSWWQTKMRFHEIVALLEYMKAVLLAKMREV